MKWKSYPLAHINAERNSWVSNYEAEGAQVLSYSSGRSKWMERCYKKPKAKSHLAQPIELNSSRNPPPPWVTNPTKQRSNAAPPSPADVISICFRRKKQEEPWCAQQDPFASFAPMLMVYQEPVRAVVGLRAEQCCSSCEGPASPSLHSHQAGESCKTWMCFVGYLHSF